MQLLFDMLLVHFLFIEARAPFYPSFLFGLAHKIDNDNVNIYIV